MKRRTIHAPFEDIETKEIYGWTDDSLDEDGMDLDEWAFIQGYYE